MSGPLVAKYCQLFSNMLDLIQRQRSVAGINPGTAMAGHFFKMDEHDWGEKTKIRHRLSIAVMFNCVILAYGLLMAKFLTFAGQIQAFMLEPEDKQNSAESANSAENTLNETDSVGDTQTGTDAQEEASAGTDQANPDPTARLKDELAEAKDKYLRLYAEFENFRRRTAKERIDLIQSANEQLLKALLPVADDFDRAEKSFQGSQTKEAEGFFLIQKNFRRILEQQGLKLMDVSSGAFNPDLHDAITQLPSPGMEGKIIDVVEKGYLLNDKVIRHAKVVVGA